jgi:hypothetical protein
LWHVMKCPEVKYEDGYSKNGLFEIYSLYNVTRQRGENVKFSLTFSLTLICDGTIRVLNVKFRMKVYDKHYYKSYMKCCFQL